MGYQGSDLALKKKKRKHKLSDDNIEHLMSGYYFLLMTREYLMAIADCLYDH